MKIAIIALSLLSTIVWADCQNSPPDTRSGEETICPIIEEVSTELAGTTLAKMIIIDEMECKGGYWCEFHLDYPTKYIYIVAYDNDLKEHIHHVSLYKPATQTSAIIYDSRKTDKKYNDFIQ